MSTLKVENLTGITSGANANKIIVPAGQTLTAPGHVIQYAQTETNTATTIGAPASATLLTINFTPKFTNSKIRVSYCFHNLRKTTGAGVNTWFNSRIFLDGVQQGNINATMGYPETFNDHRYTYSAEGELASWSGAKAVALNGYVGSTGSTWVVSYQGATTSMTVMEIAA